MGSRLVTKPIRNGILKFIEQLGLDPNQFYWDQIQSRYMQDVVVSELCHKTEEYFFIFDYDDHDPRFPVIGIMSPGGDFSPGYVHLRDSSQHIQAAFEWLTRVKRDIETPDLWSELAKQKDLLQRSTARDADNTPFTDAETKLISTSLDRVLDELISLHHITEDTREKVEERLDYLKEASTRLGRKDWFMIALTVFNIIEGFALAPRASNALIKMLFSIMKQLVQPLLTS